MNTFLVFLITPIRFDLPRFSDSQRHRHGKTHDLQAYLQMWVEHLCGNSFPLTFIEAINLKLNNVRYNIYLHVSLTRKRVQMYKWKNDNWTAVMTTYVVCIVYLNSIEYWLTRFQMNEKVKKLDASNIIFSLERTWTTSNFTLWRSRTFSF